MEVCEMMFDGMMSVVNRITRAEIPDERKTDEAMRFIDEWSIRIPESRSNLEVKLFNLMEQNHYDKAALIFMSDVVPSILKSCK